MLNLKKLQSDARRRLGLKGVVNFRSVPVGRGATGILSTSTNSLTLAHTITYSDAASLEASDIYHEFCRAKINECGFTTIEAASLDAMRDCCKDDPKYIRDASSAATIVSEVYANSLLFSQFLSESAGRRESIVLRFESSDALTSLHTQMGLWGTAGICYYRKASEWAGVPFPQKQIEQAIARASDGAEIQKEYDQVNALLGELPKIDLLQTERISDTDGIRIVDVIVRMFGAKTGLQC